jgi:hypothetical protein
MAFGGLISEIRDRSIKYEPKWDDFRYLIVRNAAAVAMYSKLAKK